MFERCEIATLNRLNDSLKIFFWRRKNTFSKYGFCLLLKTRKSALVENEGDTVAKTRNSNWDLIQYKRRGRAAI